MTTKQTRTWKIERRGTHTTITIRRDKVSREYLISYVPDIGGDKHAQTLLDAIERLENQEAEAFAGAMRTLAQHYSRKR